jgi:DNA adenine methylase
MKPPFCRNGNKYKIRNEVIAEIPDDIETYVELFVGSGAIFFSKEKSPNTVLNDLDETIIHQLQMVKNASTNQSLYRHDLNSIEKVKKFFDSKGKTKADKLLMEKIKTCNGFGNKPVTKSSQIYKEYNPEKLVKNLEAYKEKLEGVQLENKDYQEIVKKYDSPSTFFFADPPYENTDTHFGYAQDKDSFDFERFAKIMKSIKGKFLITINDSPYIRKLFKGCYIKEILVKNGWFNSNSSQAEFRKELFITNYKRTMSGGSRTLNADDIFRLLTLTGKYTIIGTGGDPEILYSSDYDLQEFWSGQLQDVNTVEKVFKDKFRIATGNTDIYITDFKCGEIGGEPIRWDKKSIQKGVAKVGTKTVRFKDALLMKSVIKMDIVALIDDIYQEFSCNYYLNFGGVTNYDAPPKNELIKSMEKDIRDYYIEGKSFKSLRRVYSLLKVTKDAPGTLQLLQEYFNSPVGILNKCKNQLDILELILTNNFRKAKRKDLVKNLNYILEILPEFGLREEVDRVINVIKHMKLKEMKQGIEYLDNFILSLIDQKTKMWIAENKNISYYIK